MRVPKLLAAIAVNLCLLPSVRADVAQVIDVKVITGDYSITPARCVPELCKTETGHFTGTFTATLVTDHIFLSNLKVVSDSGNFQLPEDPYTAPAGATASAKYSLAGDSLVVDGYINSNAFDGPLVQYHINAQKIGSTVVDEPFNPQGYFLVRQDFRKCASPMCGGFFVKKVNQAATQCADGRVRSECYVAEADWQKLGFDPFVTNPNPSINTQLLVQGKLERSLNPIVGKLGVFHGIAAYRAANDEQAEGTFFGVEDKGIRCITSPCFSLNEYTLNSRQIRTISDLDLSGVKATEEDAAAVYMLMGEDQVIPVVGRNKKVRQLAGVGIKLVAQQFYLPITPKVAACPAGYGESAKGCVTKNGCPLPKLEVHAIGGAIDPVTNKLIMSETISCADSCNKPAFITSPGYCQLPLP